MMTLANWRLFSASRADLPTSGTLKVRLQMQGATDRAAAETQVDLPQSRRAAGCPELRTKQLRL